MQITDKCTGCMACYSICPVNAIQIIQNQEGFYIPEIDASKCIHCGLCHSTCPQNKEVDLNPSNDYCFASQASADECKKSSSGAVFPLLSKYVLANGGYVCGATFDNNFKIVKHVIINNVSDLDRLRSSKYVQSYVGNIFKEIKKLLEAQKIVLFSGTPCQVAGLKSYLAKNYDNLYTIDLICHGTPSPLVWEKYLAEISQGKKIVNVNHRDKEIGWKTSLSVQFDDNKGFKETDSENLYLKGFLQNLTLNEACYFCKYNDTRRCGDITLGDFWGIENIDKTIQNIGRGVSLVILNNFKGENLFNKIDFLISKQEAITNAQKGNAPLEPRRILKHPNRKTFFKNLNNLSILENIKTVLEKKYDGIIANFWWSPNNYGAVLSAYAIQQYFLSQGLDFNLLNYIPDNKIPDFSFNFVQNNLKLTDRIYKLEDLTETNFWTQNFVVGTDQVFRYKYIGKSLFTLYTLAFTDYNKRRVAFSASFGKKEFDEANWFGKYVFKKCLQRFDSISVRENSGIKLCKDNFNLKVDDILDPVLLLDKSYWDNLAKSVETQNGNKLVSYILDENEEILKIYNYLQNRYGVEIEKLANFEHSPEYFLSAIKNAKFFITDSFHGLCFALIFNKKVICLTNKKRGNSRFENLKLKFDIDSVFYNNPEDIKNSQNLFEDYDYNKISNIIQKEREKASKWLAEAFKLIEKQPASFTYINEKYTQLFVALKNGKFFVEAKKKLHNYIILRCFKKLVNKYCNKKLIFWGASLYLADLLKKNPQIAKKVIGIIDNNPVWHYKRFHGCMVYPPEKLAELKPELVISTVKNNHEKVYREIKNYLAECYPDIKLLQDLFN